MRVCDKWIGGLFGVLLTLQLGWRLSAVEDSGLRAHRAMEIEFETEIHKSYQLQGSSDLREWEDVGGAVLGHGRTVSRLTSTRENREGKHEFQFYRIKVSEGPTNGHAPWEIVGRTLQLNDRESGDAMRFATPTTGIDLGADPDSFSYEYSRLGTNESRIELVYPRSGGGARREIVALTFTDVGEGTWSRDEYRNGVLKDHDAGLFRFVSESQAGGGGGSTPGTPTPSIPLPPKTLAGMELFFQNSGAPDRYVFRSSTDGLEIQGIPDEGSPTNRFSFNYVVLTESAASLKMNFGYYGAGGDRYEIDLQFTDGASGSFVRREYKRGVLKDTDRGWFRPNLVVGDGAGGSGGGTNGDLPPAILRDPIEISTGERLEFRTATDGVQKDDSAPTDFEYTLVGLSATRFDLRLQFKPDRWVEYELTYSDGGRGTFLRREYDKGQLKDTDTGTFSVARSAP